MIRKLSLLGALMVLLSCGAEQDGAKYLASTAWTAAYVQAATGEACDSLAPGDMSHPPEYELVPGDFLRLQEAEIFVYGGYENMMEEIADSAEVEQAILMKIQTGYSSVLIRQALSGIGEALGTQEEAQNASERLDAQIKTMAEDLSGQDFTVAVHFFQQPLAREMGWKVVEVFGPAPLQAADLDRIAQSGVNLIIDNGHNPQALPLTEILPDAAYVQWINFPGTEGTESLEDVIAYNKSQLDSALLP